ncbi:histidine phosphatase family protein [Antrihabitans sp. YC2-6]|uniref:histidine phosphatase family protein n=1 Tax=Antrihabitans sp. YC2-6 TaxID=2799498 RepID=UPI0018F3EE1D|nr:histidine phosphatase family protein [Antrihabitans sp. YC2-6]MBJ8348733.1 histidine phosphatase family protein [Antrihabitans sp. YC2-6]
MTYIALVRHGETDWNMHGRLQGSSDIPLNGTGRAQAREAAHRLAGREWHSIISSPLSRANETAQIIGAELGLDEPKTFPDLVERHYGEAEGLTDWEAYNEWPHGWYPGLEPRASVAERGLRTIVELAHDNPDDAIIVVSHGGVIRAILDVVHTRRSPRILNAAVSTLTVDANGWQVHTINNVSV